MENPEYLRKLMFVISRDNTVGFGAQEVCAARAQAAALCTDPSAAMPHSKAAAGSTKRSIHSMQPQGCHALTDISSVVPATREFL